MMVSLSPLQVKQADPNLFLCNVLWILALAGLKEDTPAGGFHRILSAALRRSQAAFSGRRARREGGEFCCRRLTV